MDTDTHTHTGTDRGKRASCVLGHRPFRHQEAPHKGNKKTGTEGGRERRRIEGGMDGWMEQGREGGREAEREARREGGRVGGGGQGTYWCCLWTQRATSFRRKEESRDLRHAQVSKKTYLGAKENYLEVQSKVHQERARAREREGESEREREFTANGRGRESAREQVTSLN
jgi:hypothetical protein